MRIFPVIVVVVWQEAHSGKIRKIHLPKLRACTECMPIPSKGRANPDVGEVEPAEQCENRELLSDTNDTLYKVMQELENLRDSQQVSMQVLYHRQFGGKRIYLYT